jgi:lysophospholipase L1-like esterase
MHILFQGDSITDAGRQREILESNHPQGLGSGYVNLIAAKLLNDKPQDALSILNRGISGNRVVDLYARWKSDALNVKPDLISILIGVNDLWHEMSSQNGVELKRFETVYTMLLEFTQETLPNTRLILCEPFCLPCGVVSEVWLKDMQHRQEIVRGLARDFKATVVLFQTAFDQAQKQAPAAYWASDGVHPSPAGHQLMADLWLKTVTI